MRTLVVAALGPLEIKVDEQPLTNLRQRKSQALLVYLLCHPEQQFSRTHLATLLWGSSREDKARTNLRQALSLLRRALPEGILLETEGTQVGIHPEATYLFDVDLLEQDLTLYRGEFLLGFAVRNAPEWEEWVQIKRERVARRFVIALDQAAHTAVANHQPAQALSYWQRALVINPWHESTHRAIMHTYAALGDRAAALLQYETLCETLADELGADPAPETVALAERIRTAEDQPMQHNLPQPDTPFFGRVAELAQLQTYLRDEKTTLVSVVGLGGMGKTRLALEVGQSLVADFRDGVWWVDLVATQHADEVPQSIALALGIAANSAAQLQEALAEEERLLILDNFEQVQTAAPFLGALCRSAPHLKLLVTSRERLNLAGERVVVLRGLAESSGDEQAAVQLFVECARRTRPNFEHQAAHTAGQREMIATICRHVGGMPLAIEIAAGWTRLLNADDIARAIQHDLDFLRHTQRGVPERHRSIEAVLRQTMSLLSEEERAALPALAVFQPGFKHEAATAVADCSLFTLLALADKALLQRTEGGRFRLHAWLRQVVQAKWLTAEAREALGNKHANHYLGWLAEQYEPVVGKQQADVLQRIEARLENIRAAWYWAVERLQVEALIAALGALYRFHAIRGLYWEAEGLLMSAWRRLEAERSDDSRLQLLRLRLLNALGGATLRLGHTHEAERHLRRALEIAQALEASKDILRVKSQLGDLLGKLGRFEEGRTFLQAAVVGYEAVDDVANQMMAYNSLGVNFKETGQAEAAREAYERCHALAVRVGDQRATAFTLNNLGVLAQEAGDAPLAKTYYEQALVLFEVLNDRVMMGMTSANLGNVFLDVQKWAEAEAWYEKGLAAVGETGEQSVRALLWLNLGDCARAQGRLDEAESYLGQALAVYRRIQNPTFAAIAEVFLARVAIARGELAQVKQRVQAALQLSDQMPSRQLDAVGEWAIATVELVGDEAQARPWLALVKNHPATTNDLQARIAPYVEKLDVAGVRQWPELAAVVATLLADDQY